ncbi:spore coat protein CotSA [Bacillaceae bacterium]
MKIAMVAPETLPVPPVRGGAVQIYIHEVLLRMPKKYKVTLFCPKEGRRKKTRYGKHIKVQRIPRKAYVHTLKKSLQKTDYRIVHVINRPDFVPALKPAAKKAKFIVNLHNDLSERIRVKGKKWYNKYKRKWVKQPRLFIANSRYIRRTARKAFPKIRAIKTIHLGIDPKKFRSIWEHKGYAAKARRKWGVQGKKVVLYVGLIDRKKGLDTLIDAVSRLKNKHRNLRLLVAGSARHGTNRLSRYSMGMVRKARKKLGKKVRFVGFVPPAKIPSLYAAADVFVCPSRWKEPFGRVNLEAMASGLPVIATKRGGIPEAVVHGKTGYLLSRPNDAKTMAQRIDQLLKNRRRREKMGKAGRKRILERFTWGKVVREIATAYRSVGR